MAASLLVSVRHCRAQRLCTRVRGLRQRHGERAQLLGQCDLQTVVGVRLQPIQPPLADLALVQHQLVIGVDHGVVGQRDARRQVEREQPGRAGRLQGHFVAIGRPAEFGHRRFKIQRTQAAVPFATVETQEGRAAPVAFTGRRHRAVEAHTKGDFLGADQIGDFARRHRIRQARTRRNRHRPAGPRSAPECAGTARRSAPSAAAARSTMPPAIALPIRIGIAPPGWLASISRAVISVAATSR